jgi:hypothetical protein
VTQGCDAAEVCRLSALRVGTEEEVKHMQAAQQNEINKTPQTWNASPFPHWVPNTTNQQFKQYYCGMLLCHGCLLSICRYIETVRKHFGEHTEIILNIEKRSL